MRCASVAARKISFRSERRVSSHDAMYAAPFGELALANSQLRADHHLGNFRTEFFTRVIG